MEKRDRHNGHPGPMADGREVQHASRPAPGKVTPASKLPAHPGTTVQRKAGTDARPVPSRQDFSADAWMDAAHRGVAALSEAPHAESRGAVVQRKGEDKNFEKASGDKPLKNEDTPDSMKLPEELTAGLKAAWGDSFPGGKSQEQGGILVRNKDGSYKFKRGAAGTTGTFSPNYEDQGKDQTLVGSSHTHPYDKIEGGYTDVSFSGGDIANLIYQEDKLKVVQSGDTQFVLVRTEEFAAQVRDLDEKGKETLYQEIKDHWNKSFLAAKGKLPERSEAATKSTCQKYKLSYYRGKEGSVSKVDTSK
jgi:hypothetical protein